MTDRERELEEALREAARCLRYAAPEIHEKVNQCSGPLTKCILADCCEAVEAVRVADALLSAQSTPPAKEYGTVTIPASVFDEAAKLTDEQRKAAILDYARKSEARMVENATDALASMFAPAETKDVRDPLEPIEKLRAMFLDEFKVQVEWADDHPEERCAEQLAQLKDHDTAELCKALREARKLLAAHYVPRRPLESLVGKFRACERQAAELAKNPEHRFIGHAVAAYGICADDLARALGEKVRDE